MILCRSCLGLLLVWTSLSLSRPSSFLLPFPSFLYFFFLFLFFFLSSLSFFPFFAFFFLSPFSPSFSPPFFFSSCSFFFSSLFFVRSKVTALKFFGFWIYPLGLVHRPHSLRIKEGGRFWIRPSILKPRRGGRSGLALKQPLKFSSPMEGRHKQKNVWVYSLFDNGLKSWLGEAMVSRQAVVLLAVSISFHRTWMRPKGR